MKDFTLDRREFIKVSLKTAIVMGIYPVFSYAEAAKLFPDDPQIKKHVTGCMWCQNGCSLIVYIKGGRAVHVTGNPDDPVTKGSMCIKPLGSLELLTSSHRLTTPLKRIGPRGESAGFKTIGWDQALDEIAGKLKALKTNYGAEALGIWASGRSASDGRKLNKAFARLYGTRNYEKTGPFCNYAGKPAGISVVGTRHTPWIYTDDDFFSADLYMFIGSNMAATRPVIYNRIRKRRAAGKCKFIAIDPRCSETAKNADSWLPIRPGSDLALALSMIHYLITHGLVDGAFIRQHTLGFEKLKQEVLEKNYDLSWGAKNTGISEDQIRLLAKNYTGTKKAIMIGNAGLSHHTNAVQTHRAFYFLAAITGHFCEKSTGYGCLNNGGCSTGDIFIPKERIPKPEIELCKSPVGWLESHENPAYPYKLRGLISTGSPLTQWPDQSRIRKIMDKLDISVYNGLTKNINAYYFDYILPAATWIESGGFAPVSDDSRFVWVPKLIDAPGECKPDRWWWIELGKRMGWDDIFTDELKNPETLQNTAGAAKGYTVDIFRDRKDLSFRAPIQVKNGKVKDRDTLFISKEFQTKSKKIEIWTEELEKKFASYGLSAIPHFYTDRDIASMGQTTISSDGAGLVLSPFQKNNTYTCKVNLVKNNKQNNSYPLYLISGRPSRAIMGNISHWIKRLNDISPDQICLIHENTANDLGLADGKKVLVQSPFGETSAKLKISSGIRKDTVFIPYSYGKKSPFTPWKSVNYLTNLEARCPVSGQVAFRGVKVRIKAV